LVQDPVILNRQRKTKKQRLGSKKSTEEDFTELNAVASSKTPWDQILEGATDGSDLLAVFAPLALGSVPNPITNPVDFLTNPLVTALTQAASCADSEQASGDLVAALLSQLFFQPLVAIVAPACCIHTASWCWPRAGLAPKNFRVASPLAHANCAHADDAGLSQV
jgi:hypothetical protein